MFFATELTIFVLYNLHSELHQIKEMTTKELIDIASKITIENIENVQNSVVSLSNKQLTWRPAAGSWNITEVLAHLNASGTYYNPVFLRKIENTRFTSTKEAFISSQLGKSAWKSMKLGNAKNVKRKFKSQKGANPSLDNSLITGSEVQSFLDSQNDFLHVFEKAQSINIRRVKIPISISKIVRLRLGDALLFVVYHNQRHIQQVLNIINHSNFPQQ